MRYLLALLLLALPASAQTHSVTYGSLTDDERDVIEPYLPAAVAETEARAGYAARVAQAQLDRTTALRRLVVALRMAQSPVYSASVASISTVTVTLDQAGDLASVTVSSASPATSRTYTAGQDGFTVREADAVLGLAQEGARAIQAVLDAQAAQAAHRARRVVAVRKLLRAIEDLAGRPAYPGQAQDVTSVAVTRAVLGGPPTGVTVSGD